MGCKVGGEGCLLFVHLGGHVECSIVDNPHFFLCYLADKGFNIEDELFLAPRVADQREGLLFVDSGFVLSSENDQQEGYEESG